MEETKEERVNSNGLILDVDQNPKKAGSWIILAIQHVLAMFVACITVPMLVYSGYLVQVDGVEMSLAAAMIAPTLVSAGVGTAFYLLMTKFRSPMFLASSFAYIGPMCSAIAPLTAGDKPNLWLLPIGMAMVGVVYVVVAILIKFFGVKWLNKLLPPIVIGPVIMVIGLSLAGSAIGNLTSAGGFGYNWPAIISGLVAMVVTAVCSHYGKKMIALIPFVIGMLAGYVVALIFTAIGYAANADYLKVISFDPFINIFGAGNIKFTSFLNYPRFLFLFGEYSAPLTAAGIGKAALLFIPVSFVTICEHIGDHKNISGILQRDLLVEPGLQRTLIGDGVATAISGVLCGAANTTYGENVAVVGVTKIASTKVILLACGIAVLLGFLSPVMAFTQTIPGCVTGGVSLILYGFIASSGVKMLIHEKVDMSKVRNIFVASVILIAGIGGLAFKFGKPSELAIAPVVEITSVAGSMILGIIMNLILKEKKPVEEAKQVEAGEEVKIEEEVQAEEVKPEE